MEENSIKVKNSVREAEMTVVYCDGSTEKRSDSLLTEHRIEIYINGVLLYSLVCSPGELEELVLGHLLTENVIASIDNIESIKIDDACAKAEVLLKENIYIKRTNVKDITSCSADNKVIIPKIPNDWQEKRVHSIEYKPEWIFDLANAIKKETKLYKMTRSAHSCLLQHQGKILTYSEDIGRHNAMDKVFGWALKHKVDLKECIVYTTGRVPIDMMQKIVRTGVPILVTKAMPTDKTVEIAKKYGITLLAAAHSDSYKVF